MSNDTTDPTHCAIARVQAAAVVLRHELATRLGISTGREMSEEIAGLAIAAADEARFEWGERNADALRIRPC